MLNKKVNEELEFFGKTNKHITHDDICKMREQFSKEEEVHLDSKLYNRALLERQFNKTMNEHDIRMIIRRSIAREPPRKEPKLTNAQIQKELDKYPPSVVYNTKVPNDFKGTKLDYLKYTEH